MRGLFAAAIAALVVVVATVAPVEARVKEKVRATPSTPYLQCAIYARDITQVDLFGDAWTWWDKAASRYARGQRPNPGAILVFKRAGKMNKGHVAVVNRIVNSREILIDHANWGGSKGRVSESVSVLDVSPRNDWTQVRVWYAPAEEHGFPYRTYGFIYPDLPPPIRSAAN